MFSKNFHSDQWSYFVENQVNNSHPEHLELLPALRARFGNLLRDELVSVRLEFKGDYVVTITAVGEALTHKPIDHFLSANMKSHINPFEWQSWLNMTWAWVEALDEIKAAHEFNLFTHHGLALIDRISSHSAYFAEQEAALQLAQAAQDFYLNSAHQLANQLVPTVRDKVVKAVRKTYHTNPANDMFSNQCETEWQELGAMLLDGTHFLLEMGVDQLEMTVRNKIKALSPAERTALWFDCCENIVEVAENHTPDDSFDLMQDYETLEEIVKSIADDLMSAMTKDWEKRLIEISED